MEEERSSVIYIAREQTFLLSRLLEQIAHTINIVIAALLLLCCRSAVAALLLFLKLGARAHNTINTAIAALLSLKTLLTLKH